MSDCDRGGGRDHVTSHCQFFSHNFMFYILSYILNINSKLQIPPFIGSCKKLNL